MNLILLLGAGFSHNWGGRLAREAFDYLLQRPEIGSDSYLRNILWVNKNNGGGFENALAQLQQEYLALKLANKEPLGKFQSAISAMFADMDKGFAAQPFEFQQQSDRQLVAALVKFDAIFTLNQDLLMERHYFIGTVPIVSLQRWNGVIIPGTRETRSQSFPYDVSQSKWKPAPTEFNVPARYQPYFKLHGSWCWQDGTDEQLMVMGGNKSLTIASHNVLKWYYSEFQKRLAVPNTRLMVIGYGFGDPHITQVLHDSRPYGLKLFIIDPLGVDVANPTRGKPVGMPNPFEDMIMGASTRPISTTFGNDSTEHSKVMRFFDQ